MMMLLEGRTKKSAGGRKEQRREADVERIWFKKAAIENKRLAATGELHLHREETRPGKNARPSSGAAEVTQ